MFECIIRCKNSTTVYISQERIHRTWNIKIGHLDFRVVIHGICQTQDILDKILTARPKLDNKPMYNKMITYIKLYE